MRVLVISDIHANLLALQAVFADAGQVDQVWCLGDIIGYGPNPNECVELLRTLPNLAACITGNHDAAVVGEMSNIEFNYEARRSLEWQREMLTNENYDFLANLAKRIDTQHDVTLAHGSPRDPTWEYILNTLIARLNFEAFNTSYCFIGHSHVQCGFFLDLNKDRVTLEVPKTSRTIKLKPRAILNPGSVGQPRDRDPRAAYAIFDTEAITWKPKRVEYDIDTVQKQILAAGLPEKHALRLPEGW